MIDDTPEVEVEESADYDNCLDENLETMPEDGEEPLQNNLADLMGIDPQPYSTEKWREHWHDMPEYSQENNAPYKTIYVHFRNVSSQLPSFSEEFINNGYVDMYKAMKIYNKYGYEGVFMDERGSNGLK